VALAGIPPWNDQSILLYHGTVDISTASVLHAVDLRRCRPIQDFGTGFYTTTRLSQAERWAIDMARQLAALPAVIKFEVERNDLAVLDCLNFVRSSVSAVDFWSFVQHCRTTLGDHHRRHRQWYDIVVGPVTGDWKKQTVIPDGDQVSFHTPAAISVLNRLPLKRKRQVV
jgi:Protein of unknown function (DUF3990)